MANSTRFLIELPDVGADADQWGTILNNAFSALEAKVTDRTAGDTISGPLVVNGTLTTTGNNTLGDSLADSHVVNGRLESNGPFQSNIVTVPALNLDLTQGNYFIKTINASSTFTFSNPPSGKAFGFTLELNHQSGVVTWPANVRWPLDRTPALTTGRVHLFMFVTDDNGAIYRGASLTDYMP